MPSRRLEGSYALVGVDGISVRLARSLDRPLRYFLAKEAAGPVLVVADRIDTIARWLSEHGHADQFHPSYTRMVPAHHLTTLRLVGCPDPAPTYVRTFTPRRNALPADPDVLGRLYVSALADEIARALETVPANEPIGVCFSGGIDSGAVFLVTHHVLLKLGMSPARLKAFTLTLGEGPDLAQARAFLDALDMGFFLESVEAEAGSLDPFEAVRVIEDYKPLDVESATMAIALLRGIRARYPGWRFLLDGDGGDENLKDYPIEENPELTIRSVVNNLMLYQEGWGVGSLKHSRHVHGRPEPLVRAHLRAAPDVRLHGLQPLHAAPRRRGGRRDPVRGPHAGQRRGALRAQGRDRRPRREGRHGPLDARLPEATLPARRRGRSRPRAALRVRRGPVPPRPARGLLGSRVSAAFPATRAGRDRFIAGRRPKKNDLDPLRPYGFFVEEEPAAPGEPVSVATIFLTNRECAYRCTMCDLWKNTLDAPTPKGAIAAQIRWALERLPAARHVKLYNAGSFFDRAAVPPSDHAAIADLVRGFERVVVECHPDLAGDAVPRFRDLLAGPELEVAVGLETADEAALEKLNKGMTVGDFERCTRRLVSQRHPRALASSS